MLMVQYLVIGWMVSLAPFTLCHLAHVAVKFLQYVTVDHSVAYMITSTFQRITLL